MSAPFRTLERIAFIGGGHMARALIAGLVSRGTPPANVAVGDPLAATREALVRDFGIHATADNGDAVRGADVVVLAVKPQQIVAVCARLGGSLATLGALVISVAAGARIATIARALAADGPLAAHGAVASSLPIVRAMPNRAALIGAGITGLYAGAGVSADRRAHAERVMGAVGATLWVDAETDLDVVTAVSGSGPAYFFYLAEALAASGMRLGLSPAVARQLARATLQGAGRLAEHDGSDMAQLRAGITSRGGTTEAALRSLDGAAFTAMIDDAVDAATQRGRELAEELP
jgi:pyrroline-5-carboxylate reductase